MNGALNLLPASRVRALRLRARARAWTGACAAYVVLLGAGWAWTALSRPATASPAGDLAETQTRLADAERACQALRRSVSVADERLSTARAVGDHPDWSLLLDLLARAKRADVAFERVSLSSRGGGPPRAGEGLVRRGPWTLSLAGVGGSQRAVSDFALRLEESGVFESVAVVELRSRGDARPDRPALVEFGVQCALRDGASKEPRR
ncbi:MAG: PilN domain-containing protein [Planctomycetota bacterium]|nr:PilN domain-containing protein [Planctomycetota bacterium]